MPLKPVSAPVVTKTQPVAAPIPAFSLSGVVEGDSTVAIISEAGSPQHIVVHEGQNIDGKYHVESISRSGVTLRYDGRNVLLKLGGKNAAQDRARK
jgi:type II secretory pathway component PulC